jgi:hypothetical protein
MSIIKRFGQIVTGGLNVTTPVISKGTVTQVTSITTPVTVDSSACIITTVSSTLAAGGVTTFTINNSAIRGNSVIVATLTNYTGTTGVVYVRCQAVAAGSVNIIVRNLSAADPLNGIVTISLVVL